jgi:ubiquinone/menaquinone biosynthesis C-methylase UbiE
MATTLRTKVSRFNDLALQEGLRFAVSKGLRVVSRPLVEVAGLHFFAADLSETPASPRLNESMSIGTASSTEAEALMMDRSGEEIAREIDRRFSRGDRCLAIRAADGTILHTRWLTANPTHIPEINRYVVPQSGQLYMFDGYTRAEARRRGVDSAMRLFIFRLAREEGMRQVLSYVHSENSAGLKAAQKLQSEVGKVRYVTLLGRWRRVSGQRTFSDQIELLTEASLRDRQQEYEQRTDALNQWFQSWLSLPEDRHSTGFCPLPEDCMKATARHISAVLALDPKVDDVLDVGCSSAVVSRHVAPSCRSFQGVDATDGLIADIKPGSVTTGSGTPAIFSVADGRKLPFPDQCFTKVYCSGVIHMLPSREDGMRMMDEMIRVCAPGGQVLVAAVPDTAKSARARLLAWRRSSLAGKLRLGVAMITPKPLRRLAQRLGIVRKNPIAFLEYDLTRIKAHYEARGCHCQVLDFPDDFWSRDFRTSRSNLLIRVARTGSSNSLSGQSAG